MPSTETTEAEIPTRWVLAKNLKPGNVIVLQISPPTLMPVTGIKIVEGLVHIENPRQGETRAAPEMKIRIQN